LESDCFFALDLSDLSFISTCRYISLNRTPPVPYQCPPTPSLLYQYQHHHHPVSNHSPSPPFHHPRSITLVPSPSLHHPSTVFHCIYHRAIANIVILRASRSSCSLLHLHIHYKLVSTTFKIRFRPLLASSLVYPFRISRSKIHCLLHISLLLYMRALICCICM
jgi:hypothetical protein